VADVALPAPEFLDLGGVDVEPNDRKAPSGKSTRQREPDITKPNDPDDRLMTLDPGQQSGS
jgi:hypothetical protein